LLGGDARPLVPLDVTLVTMFRNIALCPASGAALQQSAPRPCVKHRDRAKGAFA
jgi:hypothetical protein